jgi:hypothetical protein
MSRRSIMYAIFLLLGMNFVALAALYAKELEIGMPFLDARKLLIQEGWQPVKTAKSHLLAEKYFDALHIIEVESCAADAPTCMLNYKKGDTCLSLITNGAEISHTQDIKKQTYVSSWDYTCPDERWEDQEKQSNTKNYASVGISPFHRSPFNGELSFLGVRKTLIQKGWRPISVHMKVDKEHSDLEKQLMAADIHEGESIVYDKTYTGRLPSCVFYYKKDGLCLQIMADGKNIKDLQILKDDFYCPEK